MSNKKFLLLYVGPGYKEFSQYQCNKIVKQSGATDFVLTTAYAFNYCQPNDYILTKDYVNKYVKDEYFGTTSKTDISIIKNQMFQTIDTANSYDSKIWNYSHYLNCVIYLAQKLYNANHNVRFWIGIPLMLQNCTAAAMCYNYYFHDYIINASKVKLLHAGLYNNCEGFYYGQEDLPQWYTKFNLNATNSYFDNPVAQNMDYISGVVHYMNKKLLWIPYYREDGSELPKRVGNIINQRNYFDYAILQPSYYFNPNLSEKAVTLVKDCVNKQNCVNVSSKKSKTEIGAEMEIDINAKYNSANLNRYNTYVKNYSSFVNNKPLAFYADCPEILLDSFIFNKIKTFFTKR